MNNEKYRVIDDTECIDFLQIIKKHGFDDNDFDLSEIDKTSSPAVKSSEIQIFPVTGEAVVTRKSTKLTRRYPAGDKQAWVSNFLNDLAGGIFGNP
jgi:hypothetical protein